MDVYEKLVWHMNVDSRVNSSRLLIMRTVEGGKTIWQLKHDQDEKFRLELKTNNFDDIHQILVNISKAVDQAKRDSDNYVREPGE